MILWITGNRHAGKTTLAKNIQKQMPGSIVLDGDDMRESISSELGFSENDRRIHNERVAHLARKLEDQGFTVIIATICPEYVREEIYNISKCNFIHL